VSPHESIAMLTEPTMRNHSQRDARDIEMSVKLLGDQLKRQFLQQALEPLPDAMRALLEELDEKAAQ
jgi:hypothetical protein